MKHQDDVGQLLELLQARQARKEKRAELLRRADQLRASIADKEQELAAVEAERAAAEDRARAAAALGHAPTASEEQSEADTVAGRAHRIRSDIASAQDKLADAQREITDAADDIASLDSVREKIHSGMTLQDTLESWNAPKKAITELLVSALRRHWLEIEREAHRLAPVLHDRRRVDRSQWTAGRDGSVDIRKIVHDIAMAAVGKFLEEHTIEPLPKLGGRHRTLYRGPGKAVRIS